MNRNSKTEAALPLPAGIRSRIVAGVNGLDMHVLEAGHETGGRPCLLLLHGFPELAYSWRKVMPALAEAGLHVIAPDQRGYGRTTGWDARYEGDVGSFRMLNLVRDVLGLLSAQGVHDFLRAYYRHKSADWPANQPHPLAAMCAAELARLPTYYVMDQGRNMAQTVADEMPAPSEIAGCRWLPDDELRFYSAEYGRTGFQGGLNWYRCMKALRHSAELQIFDGRTIDIPAMFIAGRSDWGTYQKPGDFEKMQTTACTDFRGAHFIEGAGHWVQQEQPQAVNGLLLDFLGGVR